MTASQKIGFLILSIVIIVAGISAMKPRGGGDPAPSHSPSPTVTSS